MARRPPAGHTVAVTYTFDPPLQAKVSIWGKPDSAVWLAQMEESIVVKTDDGVDADGRPFKAYSPGYAARAPGGPRVDLEATGKMLDKMRGSALKRRAKITFPKSIRRYAVWVNQSRRFLAIGKVLERELAEFAAIRVAENISAAREGSLTRVRAWSPAIGSSIGRSGSRGTAL